MLQAANRGAAAQPALPRLVIAGATGVLGNEVLSRLVGLQQFAPARVLSREDMTTGLRDVVAHRVAGDVPAAWEPLAAETGIILFEPPRLYYDRERALWTPQPAQLLEVAAWMRRGGVQTLAVVLPHAQGRLPEALKRGLAGLEEGAVAALGFERLLFIRSAQKPGPAPAGSWLQGVAHWMLGIGRLMVASSEQPVRAARVAQLVAAALELAPPGIHVAAPELVWQAAQGDVQAVAARWLRA